MSLKEKLRDPSIPVTFFERVPPAAGETCLDRSLDLAQRILMGVSENLSPDPPPTQWNAEHVN